MENKTVWLPTFLKILWCHERRYISQRDSSSSARTQSSNANKDFIQFFGIIRYSVPNSKV